MDRPTGYEVKLCRCTNCKQVYEQDNLDKIHTKKNSTNDVEYFCRMCGSRNIVSIVRN